MDREMHDSHARIPGNPTIPIHRKLNDSHERINWNPIILMQGKTYDSHVQIHRESDDSQARIIA